MDLTPANLRALRTQVFTDWRRGYDEAPVFYPQVAMVVPSSSSQNDYAWMGQLPGMKEWIGGRIVENLITHSYTLKNKTWEDTLGILRDDIDDDNLGVYTPMFEFFGMAARQHPDELVTDLMKTGHSTTAFDDQNFYDTAHPESPADTGSATYSNYNSSGMALDQDNFMARRAAIMSRNGDGGRKLKLVPGILQVPPALENEGLTILVATDVGGGNTNISANLADLLVTPDLAGDDTTWYLHVTGLPIKPFVFQQRRALNLEMKADPSDHIVLEENEVRTYADARYNAGHTLPFLSDKNVA